MKRCRALNAKLVYCSISAFGQSGPYAEKPGFDTLGQAMSGLLSLLSDPNDPKVMGMAVSDYVTGLSAGYGILGALLARQQFRRRLPRGNFAFASDAYRSSAKPLPATCAPATCPTAWRG